MRILVTGAAGYIGASLSAQERWDAVKNRAQGKVRFQPDPQR
jgi:nucleoside-diphosphate-sugar epimerase